MAYLLLLLRIAFTRVRPVRRLVAPKSAMDHDMRSYLSAYMTGDAVRAECEAWIYWGDK